MTLDHMSELEPNPSDPQERSTRERLGRAWTITSAVIVALIVLAGVAVVYITRDRDPAPPAAQPATEEPAPSASASAEEPSLPAEDQTVPTSAPEDVAWTLFEGVALPESSTAGPSRVEGPVYAGYAQTPTGALLAAAQISYRYLITPGEGWREVVEQQVVPGPGRDAFVEARAQVSTTDVAAGTYGQLAGFRFVTYASDTAVIQYVTRFENGNLQVTTDTVQWIDGDWKLQLQPDGSESPTVQNVDSLAGFVPWSGL